MNINMNIKIRSIYIIRNKNSLTQIVKVSEPVNSLNYEQKFVIEIVRGGVHYIWTYIVLKSTWRSYSHMSKV